MNSPSQINNPILLYDGECKFCNLWVALIQRQKAQQKFRYFALQSKEGRELLRQYEVDESIDSVVVVHKGNLFVKSNAALKVAKILGGRWNSFLIFWLIPRPIRNWLYDLIARNRHRFFTRRENCDIHN